MAWWLWRSGAGPQGDGESPYLRMRGIGDDSSCKLGQHLGPEQSVPDVQGVLREVDALNVALCDAERYGLSMIDSGLFQRRRSA